MPGAPSAPAHPAVLEAQEVKLPVSFAQVHDPRLALLVLRVRVPVPGTLGTVARSVGREPALRLAARARTGAWSSGTVSEQVEEALLAFDALAVDHRPKLRCRNPGRAWARLPLGFYLRAKRFVAELPKPLNETGGRWPAPKTKRLDGRTT